MRLYRPILAIVAVLLAAGLSSQAEAGLLEFLFGADPEPAPQIAPQRTHPDSTGRRRGVQGELRFGQPREGSGFASEPNAGGFCVRTCDGYFFPLIKSTRATRQQSCELACPSASMEVYDGAAIETARNSKGHRYSALPAAFAFRDKANSSCACNDPSTSQAFFEKTARNDPTLQSGDILVEETGAFVYRSDKFVPLGNASFLSSTLRDRLRAMLRRTASARSTPAQATTSGPTGEISFGKDDRTGSTTR
ncbi:DUF2865 domain-containing protein [Methylocystis sp. MJC1]|jgi:hypothetical protein|uniref:DUF2865 domain-containing protein n=1 Tax=Methylocystis sp. MJC1 TaxID=2654282 RepID=UPI0013E9BE00|nr:DUF2865 domain-containing protein [Methylocystis sp. MJC1]KAF2992156.1 hypothetical protein MJC1_00528 [Methylocystis sp. MJC1]MBU6527296.1 DUF2865 domain-containing protein [Methylocystis sp. MJC1]UZX10250.1 DUF2865 domain-containing protein [Methylocystis sp. MJC1]